MQISGLGPIHGPHSLNPAHIQQTTPVIKSPSDEVQISPLARMLERVDALPEIRHERVAALRAAIASGSYDTPERMSLAVGRLLDEMA